MTEEFVIEGIYEIGEPTHATLIILKSKTHWYVCSCSVDNKNIEDKIEFDTKELAEDFTFKMIENVSCLWAMFDSGEYFK